MGLEVENLNKSFNKKKVVKHISFKIDEPSVFGLIGPNGAGKTTIIRMILGILSKDAGSIKWNGKKINRKLVSFGYLPEERGIYTKIPVKDQLMYFARLRGMKYLEAKKATEDWCEELGMTQYLDVPAEQLSKGNQQKIQLISAFVNNPDLLFLDEPFAGLDPVNTKIIKQAMKRLIDQGTYIILSAHQMSIVEEYCQNILLINKGEAVLNGNLSDIKKSYGKTNLLVRTAQDISSFLPSDAKIINKTVDSIELVLDFDSNELLKNLVDNNIEIKTFEIKEPSLEEIFIKKVGEE